MSRPWRGRFAVRFHRWMLNGHPGNVTPACQRFIVRATRAGLVVTSTTGGSHARTSFHFSKPLGRAVDVGLPATLVGTEKGKRRMVRFQRAEARHPSRFFELFGPANSLCVKNGQRISLTEGSALENLHDTHVHGALR